MKHTIDLSDLRAGECVEFFELFQTKTDPGGAAVPDRYRTMRADFQSLYGQMREAYGRDRRSEQTEAILRIDGERDRRLIELFGIVRYFCGHPESNEIRAAAKKVTDRLSSFGTAAEVAREDLVTESATIDRIIDELQSPLLAPSVALLPVAPWVRALHDANAALRAAYVERGDARSPEDVARFKRLRAQVSTAYRQILKRIDVYGEDHGWAAPWKEIRDRVDELAGDFSRRLAQREGRKESKKADAPGS